MEALVAEGGILLLAVPVAADYVVSEGERAREKERESVCVCERERERFRRGSCCWPCRWRRTMW